MKSNIVKNGIEISPPTVALQGHGIHRLRNSQTAYWQDTREMSRPPAQVLLWNRSRYETN